MLDKWYKELMSILNCTFCDSIHDDQNKCEQMIRLENERLYEQQTKINVCTKQTDL